MSADPLLDRLARALAGRYTVARELGRGGMATVYLATDVKLGRRVAIKVLPPTTRAYLGSGRFQREVLFAAQLSHPHIVPLFEADEADGLTEYMSPEQASGEKRIDARSDVYALAAVLYEMLAGEPPFTGPSAQAIVARVLADSPRPIHTIRPNLPAHIDRALTAGLAKLPADRPPTARTFVDMLTRPTAERRWGAGPWWQIAALAALLLGGAAIALSVARHHPPPADAAPAGILLVPGGAYRVGGTGPGGTVVQLDSFSIDSTEVTVGAYAPFLVVTHSPAPWAQTPPATWPVTGVLWAEAQAFCRWRDPAARLPTEAEWEAAAGGLRDRKSTRLNSSHTVISYAVF